MALSNLRISFISLAAEFPLVGCTCVVSVFLNTLYSYSTLTTFLAALYFTVYCTFYFINILLLSAEVANSISQIYTR